MLVLPDVSSSQGVVYAAVGATVVSILLWVAKVVVSDGSTILDRFQRASQSHEDAVRGVLDARVDYLEARLHEELAYRTRHDATLAEHRLWDERAAALGAGPIAPLYPRSGE